MISHMFYKQKIYIKNFLKLYSKKFISAIGYKIITNDNFLRLSKIEQSKNQNDKSTVTLEFLKSIPIENVSPVIALIDKSRSDLHQDLFVLSELNFKKNGLFIEIGATNGVNGSNTYLLEEDFFWKGILVEPALNWHKALSSNRPKSIIDKRCVYSSSNSNIDFVEVYGTGLSSIKDMATSDKFASLREAGESYKVETVSLNDLLIQHNFPPTLDYLSIDTEGSEYEILKSFDFARFQFKVITCEHNYSAQRQDLIDLLRGNGYIRKYLNCSQYDDWWVKA